MIPKIQDAIMVMVMTAPMSPLSPTNHPTPFPPAARWW
jgi:hypothetical protein